MTVHDGVAQCAAAIWAQRLPGAARGDRLQNQDLPGRQGLGGATLLGATPGDKVSTLVGLVGCTGDQSAVFETVITVVNRDPAAQQQRSIGAMVPGVPDPAGGTIALRLYGSL